MVGDGETSGRDDEAGAGRERGGEGKTLDLSALSLSLVGVDSLGRGRSCPIFAVARGSDRELATCWRMILSVFLVVGTENRYRAAYQSSVGVSLRHANALLGAT
jgi:hypothetical protein